MDTREKVGEMEGAVRKGVFREIREKVGEGMAT